MNCEFSDIENVLFGVFRDRSLGRATLGGPRDKSVLRAQTKLFSDKNGDAFAQIATYFPDGKVRHENLPLKTDDDCRDAARKLTQSLKSSYRNLNIVSDGGTCDAMVSSSGKPYVKNKIKSPASPSSPSRVPAPHDKNKRTILKEGTVYPFLVKLDVQDTDGRIFDRRRSKFRQINKFLENVEVIYRELPAEGTLKIYDLCCGKSYLTFAVHYFLTKVKGRTVDMLGMDLKSDVIAYCEETARSLGCDGLHFRCGDIGSLTELPAPDLVLSLHACDIATDVVLTTAAKANARVILSTPCCHKQMMRELSDKSPLGQELSAVLEHSMLKQKLCDALTDSLRCKRLQSEGYEVTVTELIDPEDTPKNLMIRAVKRNIPAEKKAAYREEFLRLSELAGVLIFGSDEIKP